MLPNPPDQMVEHLRKMCYHFVWEGKKDKVKRTVAIHSIKEGGIGIPHIESYVKSLILTWFKKMQSVCYLPKWKIILHGICPEVEMVKDYCPIVLKTGNRKINHFRKNVLDSYRFFLMM